MIEVSDDETDEFILFNDSFKIDVKLLFVLDILLSVFKDLDCKLLVKKFTVCSLFDDDINSVGSCSSSALKNSASEVSVHISEDSVQLFPLSIRVQFLFSKSL